MPRSVSSCCLHNPVVLLLFAIIQWSAVSAEPQIPVSIIIDDLGYNLERGRTAIEIPAALTYSILPQTPYSRPLAELARRHDKEVLLHLPMEGSRLDANEPDSLNDRMPEGIFRNTLQKHLLSVPHVVGVNNHMGSMLTPHPLQMDWLMEELAGRSLFFVDSRTTAATVAASAAQRMNVPFLQRDVFLDNNKDHASIRNAFHRFVQLAKERNGGVAIAHPHPETLSVLAELLPELSAHRLQLVSVSEQIKLQGTYSPYALGQALPENSYQTRQK